MNESPARKFEPIVASDRSTVVAEYTPEPCNGGSYQSEDALEKEFIALLESQAYERLNIRSEAELIVNLRAQLEALNRISFSDAEWERFFGRCIAGKNEGIAEKTARIQSDHIQPFTRDDGSVKNIWLLDKRDIHNNSLQVLNQYSVGRGGAGGAAYANRYDVTVLVNGLPMVHVELKRRGVDIREAFNQINRYQRDSFWSGTGLFEYVQLFVISNGTLTKYYSNTTRKRRIEEATDAKRRRAHSSNSFEFTSWWADATNRPIRDLPSFTKTFFARHTLLAVLTRYCVLTKDKKLMVMRPYQIVATERILRKIDIATNAKTLGTVAAGGYVWHTTGSGKTLTSFKTAQIASELKQVDKVLFVVDRKDLDYQTMREYDNFQEGAANSNTSTRVLKHQLETPNAKIIITTIQKLATFINASKGHTIFDGRLVIIFDECHRSQFGDMHVAITSAFKNYHLFGFTGTPIFAANAGSGKNYNLRTTEQAFGERLHTYTIQDAITDKNVLPFKVDYLSTIGVGNVQDKPAARIEREETLLAPERLHKIVRYTLEHFDQKTKRAVGYEHKVVSNVEQIAARPPGAVLAQSDDVRVKGFNALFATASIEAARRYYNAFQVQQEQLPQHQRLKIALIYSFAANPDLEDGLLAEEGFDTAAMPGDAREFLEDAIQDYNKMFGTSYDTTADRFENYYKDLSLRMKNRQVDLVIVVNMFLTGFDATTLNTLFVDKTLRSHGLIQAFSRTNRILNSVKVAGNIVCFRDLQQETEEAIALFGNKDAKGIVLMAPYEEYYQQYTESVERLLAQFPEGEVIEGEAAQKEFIALFGTILRLQNILNSFDEFEGEELLSERQNQDYRSVYLDLHAELRNSSAEEKERIVDDVVFEIELIKQVEINVDFILMLVQQYRDKHGDDTEVRSRITRTVDASPSLRNKRDLIEDFVDQISPNGDVREDWQAWLASRHDEELEAIIAEERLQPQKAREFMKSALDDGEVPRNGTAITAVLPHISRFDDDGKRSATKQRVLDRLSDFLERFRDLRTESPEPS